jgi:hypothetical protein
MIRTILIALSMYASASIAADSLHVAPIGTTVSGSFDLGGRLIPLPEGDYVLAARTVSEPAMLDGSISMRRPKIVRVMLVQVQPPRLRAAVLASAALLDGASYRFTWSGQPCKKEDTLYRADLTGSHGEDENCLLVDHALGTFGPRSQGIWKEAANWLAEHNVQLPVPVLIVASVTRNQQWQHVAAAYAFNPRMYGCDAPRSRTWADSPWHKKAIDADPQRARFVESVTAWGKVAQRHLDDLVAGRPPATDARPAIHSCASAQAALEPRRIP